MSQHNPESKLGLSPLFEARGLLLLTVTSPQDFGHRRTYF